MRTKEDTVSVNSWQDMQHFGLQVLTGETCRFSSRLLFDLNEDGIALMSDYLGIGDTCFGRPWNSTVEGKPAIGSVLLHRESLRQVAEFACGRAGALAIVTMPHSWVALFAEDLVQRYEQLAAESPSIGADVRRFPPQAGPCSGTRYVHMATGRTV